MNETSTHRVRLRGTADQRANPTSAACPSDPSDAAPPAAEVVPLPVVEAVDLVACQCACHVSSGAHRTPCSVDIGYGVGCGPHTDERCVMPHNPPAKRFVGLFCARHYHHIGDRLDQIVELYALMPEVLVSGQSSGDDVRSAAAIHSAAPGRLDVMALTDHRAVLDELAANDQVPDVPGVLAFWARSVAEHRPPPTRVRLLGPTCRRCNHLTCILIRPLVWTVWPAAVYLKRERHWIAQQAAAARFLDELELVQRALARAVGDSMWPKPIGKCPNCQTWLYNTIGVDQVTCRRCKTVWAGVHLARLRLIHEREDAQRKKAPQ